jgi:hypothetical protein
MYRNNDVALLAKVFERARLVDHRGVVEAAGRLWCSEPEIEGSDHAEAETWQALVAMRLVGAAVEHGLRLVQHKQKLRLAAFVRIGEHIGASREGMGAGDHSLPRRVSTEDAATLLELADVALECGWPSHLQAAFARLEEGGAGRRLWGFIERNRAALAATPATWTAVAYVLSCTPTGAAADLDAWFSAWADRDDRPMWTMAMYIHRRRGLPGADQAALLDLARRVRRKLPPDGTAAYLLTLELEALLAAANHAEFMAVVDGNEELLARPIERMDHPALIHANRVRLTHRVEATHFQLRPVRLRQPGADASEPQRPNQQLLDAILDQVTDLGPLRKLRQLLALGRDEQGKAVALFREQRQLERPPQLAWLQGEFERALRSRASVARRVSMAIFG